jgi:hypothetical protein
MRLGGEDAVLAPLFGGRGDRLELLLQLELARRRRRRET